MKQILTRLKQGLPEGSCYKPRTILKWFLFGVSESYSIRMTRKHQYYTTPKPCGSKTEHIHPCDFVKKPGYYGCRNCELGI